MKKFFLITTILLLLAVIFLACSEERDHASPFDPVYWEENVPSVENFNISSLAIDKLELRWTFPKIPDGYSVKIDKKVDYSDWLNISYFESTSEMFVDSVAEVNSRISYRICICFDEQVSLYQIDSVYNLIPFPTGLEITQLNEIEAQITWNDDSIGEEWFYIDRRTDSDSLFTRVGEIAGDNNTNKVWIDHDLTLGYNYEYRLKAVFGQHSSYYSSISFTNNILPPSNLSYENLSSTSCRVSWDDNSNLEQGFTIDRKEDENAWVNNYAVVTENVNSWIDNTYNNKKVFYYRVRSFNESYFSEYSEELKTTPLYKELIFIPSGSFSMGSDLGENFQSPIHEVSLTNDYYMGKCEVVNKLYCEILNYALNQNLIIIDSGVVKNLNGYQKNLFDLNSGFTDITYNGSSFEVKSGMEYFPVEGISWYGSAFYCNILSKYESLQELYDLSNWNWSCVTYGESGYRLPTEAEWEYAARYNDGRKYPWGETQPTADYCNYSASHIAHSIEVGSYSPLGDSSLGLCDMSGNVEELCNDNFVGDYYEECYNQGVVVNPTGNQVNGSKMVRSGSYNVNEYYLTTASHGWRDPSSISLNVGFRIVKLP